MIDAILHNCNSRNGCAANEKDASRNARKKRLMGLPVQGISFGNVSAEIFVRENFEQFEKFFKKLQAIRKMSTGNFYSKNKNKTKEDETEIWCFCLTTFARES